MSKAKKSFVFENKRGNPTVMQLLELKSVLSDYASASEQTNTLRGIVATRAAIDLDHLARLISSPSIDVGSFWIKVKPKKGKR